MTPLARGVVYISAALAVAPIASRSVESIRNRLPDPLGGREVFVSRSTLRRRFESFRDTDMHDSGVLVVSFRGLLRRFHSNAPVVKKKGPRHSSVRPSLGLFAIAGLLSGARLTFPLTSAAIVSPSIQAADGDSFTSGGTA